MKSNIIMQSNNGKHRERTISSVLFDARTLILTLVITMTMVMGTAFFTSTAQAVSGSGATVRVATFDQLNDALGNGGVSDIIIDPQAAEEFADNEDAEISFDGSDVFYIPIEYPLVVSHDVTISSEVAVNFARSGNGGSGKYDSKAFRGQNEVTPALFNVDQGKTLELSGDIAMTGEEVSATFDSAEGSFLFAVKSRDNLGDDDEDDNEAWSYGSDPGKLSTGGYFIYTKGGNVVMNDGILLMGLNTKNNVKDIAPVYIDGTAKAATLTVDGAKIVDNNLGQTEDGNSTAGAVILKGSNATAALNSGEIGNNNADVAGIIVKEEAELELGNDFGINDSDIYDEKAEEATDEETAKEEATEEKAAEETKEEAAQEETKEETPEEAPIVAPKKSLKSFKAPATQMRSGGNQASTDQTPSDTESQKTVATSKQLEKALNDPKVTTIIIDPSGALNEVTNADENGNKYTEIESSDSNAEKKFYLPVDKPLAIAKGSGNRSVTIKTKDGKDAIIARSEQFRRTTDNNSAIFNVPSGVTLTLDANITMSGDKVTSVYKYKDTSDSGYDPGQGFEKAIESGVLVVESGDGKYFGREDDIDLFSIVSASQAETLTINSSGYLFLSGSAINSTPKVTNNTNPFPSDLRLREIDDKGVVGGFPSELKTGKSYVISTYNQYTNIYKYLYLDDGVLRWTENAGSALKFKAAESATSTGNDDDHEYAPVKFKFKVQQNKVTNGNKWTTEDVKAGGFFVNVNGGKLVIKDKVTLRDIGAGPNVKNVAPIVVRNAGEFDMQGGTISGNRIGYGGDREGCPNSESTIQTLKEHLNFTTNTNAYLTNTAGGVIFEGANTKGTITGGSINGNIADSGAIIVKDGAFVTMGTQGGANDSVSINNNTGFHHSGAVLVENGGTFHMLSGQINGNVTWNRGGAVFATEWGTAGLVKKKNGNIQNLSVVADRTGGNFIMDGGELKNNMAFVRGGAINVESDGVVLRKGTIEGNMCKSLGGAIYVEGDDPNYSYTLTINKGYIGGNTAVMGADTNNRLDRGIGANGGLVNGTKSYGVSAHKDNDFPNLHSGNGGGVWLCPLGGTSVFASTVSDNNNKVIIDNNTSAHSGKTAAWFGWGDDFYLSRGKGAALVQNLLGVWEKDNGDGVGTNPSGLTLNGPLGLVNKGKQGGGDYSAADVGNDGIKIINNVSRDGGGIAADGTVLLGKSEPVYRFHTELELKKVWDNSVANADKKNVTLALQYEYNGTKYPLTVTGSDNTSINYTITLTGTAATDVSEDDVIYETSSNGIQKAKAFVPQYVEHRVSETETVSVPLYRIRKPDTTGNADANFYDLRTPNGIKELYQAVGDNKSKDFDVEWNLWINEKVGQQNNDYAVSQFLENKKVTVSTKKVAGETLPDPLNPGQSIATVDVNFSTVAMTHVVRNTKLVKKNADKNVALKGAEFAIYKAKVGGSNSGGYSNGAIFVENSRGTTYSDDSAKIQPINNAAITTNNDGKIAIDNLVPGTYLMFETKAPAGYERAKSPWFLHVSSTGEVTIVAIPKAKEGRIIGSGNDDIAAIYDSTGNTYADRVSNLNSWVCNKYWFKSWFNVNGDSDNLSPGNTIDNVRLSNRDGTTLEDKVLVNNPFIAYKTDNASPAKPIENVNFQLYGVQYDSNSGKLRQGNSLGSDNGLIISNNKGELDLSKALQYACNNGSWGTTPGDSIAELRDTNVFMLRETTTSSQYKNPEAPWLLIYYRNTGNIELKEYEDKYTENSSGLWDYSKYETIGLYNSGTAVTTGNKTIVNERNDIKLTKVDVNSVGTKLVNAQFTLYRACDIEITDSGISPSVITVKKTDGNVDAPVRETIVSSNDANTLGEVNLGSLQPGAYLLFEKAAPEGYQRTKTPWLIVVASDGTYRMAKVKGTATKYSNGQSIYSAENAGWEKLKRNLGSVGWNSSDFEEQIGDNNYGKLKNTPQDLEIIKKDSKEETPLVGVTFNLYEGEANSVNGHWEYEVSNTTPVNNELLRSGEGGKFTLPTLTPAADNNQHGYNVYLLFEVDPLTGYKKPEAPWGLRVDKDGGVELWRLSDNPSNATQVGADKQLSEILIMCTDMTQITSSVITNERKPIELYKVNEKKGADGKVAADATKLGGASFKLVPVTIDSNSYFHVTGKEHDGTCTLANFDGTVVTSSTNAGEIGKITINNLAAGDYFLFETVAPNGFVRSTSPWIIRVTDNSSGRSWKVYSIKSGNEGLQDYGGNKTEVVPAGAALASQTIGYRWWAFSWFEMIYDSNSTSSTNPTEARLANEPKFLTKVNADSIASNANNPEIIRTGATFKLYAAKKDSFTYESTSYNIVQAGEHKADLTADDNGQIEIPSSITTVAGEYLLVEETAPNGFQKPQNAAGATIPWLIKVKSNGDIEVLHLTGNYVANTDNNRNKHLRESNYVWVNSATNWWWKYDKFEKSSIWGDKNMIPNTPNDLSLTKVDGYSTSTKLGGAQFEIFDTTYVSSSNGKWVYKIGGSKGLTGESDSNTGKFTLPNLPAMSGFSNGGTVYLMREVKAPEGYELDDEPWALLIKRSSTTSSQNWSSSSGTQNSDSLYQIYLFKAHKTNKANEFSFTDSNGSKPDCTSVVKNYRSVSLWKIDSSSDSVNISYNMDGDEVITGDHPLRLDGVKFDLWEANDNWTKKGTTALKTDITSSSVEASKGKVELGALNPGKYLLYETQSKDSSYVRPTEPWRITIGSDGKIASLEVYTVNGYIGTDHDEYLTNSKVFDLPKTGGMGTYWFMIIGAMLMGFAVTAGITKMDILKMFRR